MSDKEFYDLVYDAWCQGKNPDLVSEDRYDYHRGQGYYPDEISLNMVYPKSANVDTYDEEAYYEYMREEEEYYRQLEEQEDDDDIN